MAVGTSARESFKEMKRLKNEPLLLVAIVAIILFVGLFVVYPVIRVILFPDAETYLELSRHPRIVAAKEASGDLSAAARTAKLCGDALTLYSGNDDQVLPILSLGGKGVISVLANVAPKDTHEMVTAYLAGDTTKATALQLKYIPLIDALFSEVNPIPVKEALNLMGFHCGPCRLPLTAMEEKNREKLAAALKELGLMG